MEKKVKYVPVAKNSSHNEEERPKKTKRYIEKGKQDTSISHQKYPQSNKRPQTTKRYRQKAQKNSNYPAPHQNKDLPLMNDKIKIPPLPHYIVDYSTVVDEEELGIKVETRYIRKYFLEKFYEASKDQLIIRRASYAPCIFFEYCDEDRRVTNVDYKDVIRQNRAKFQDKPELVSVLFDQLYERVEPKYFHLAIFGIKLAKDKKVPMTHASVFKQESIETQLMFYYLFNKKRKQINFTLIDKNLQFLYFRSEDILKLRQQYPEQYDLYMQFEQGARKHRDRVVGDRWDILENEQIEFNEREIRYIGESIDKLKEKLSQKTKELHEAIFEIEDQHKEKSNLLRQMNEESKPEDYQKIKNIDDQLQQLTRKKGSANRLLKQIDLQKKQLTVKNQINQWFYIKSIKKVTLLLKQLISKLPILMKKREIIDMLRHAFDKPVIIEGQTGSGKSTQLPQILIQYCGILEDPQSKPILVTQPRRLATRTLAQRVALELGEQRPNNFVDFKNSIDKEVNQNAKIVFKLDRLVLDELTIDQQLSKYSCLVIDQAHERTISIDVIIGLVRQLLQRRRDFKVIITSASMDVELFQREFETKALKVSGRLFNVSTTYKQYEEETTTLAKIQKVINEQILHDENSLKQKFKGHVLVFCSGVDEINKLTEIYATKLNPSKFMVFALHGRIAPQEQRKAFLPCKEHKLIFASRIAETAITIDGVRVVVDPGEDIELIYDQRYKFSSMKIRPISQSSAKQRAGRAGRTAPGFCFRLYSQDSFFSRAIGKVPEMENSSLDTVVLRLKSLGIDDVIQFPYISKPDKEGLFSSIENLKMIGALDNKEQITPIGDLLIVIPVQPMLSRSVLQALLVQHILSVNEKVDYEFESQQWFIENKSVVESVVQILCMIVNSSGLFHISQENQNDGDMKKYLQFQVNSGDFYFLRSIYKQFKQTLEQVGDRAELSFWIKEFYLSKKTLKQVKELESQIMKIVKSIGRSKKMNLDSMEDELDEIKEKLRHCRTFNDILMACLITSFIPNLCIYSQDPQIGYTLINQKRPIAIYGTSTLPLVGLTQKSPKWILAYDFYTSERGKFYCKIAQGIDFSFLKNTVNRYVWKKFQIAQIQRINPFYQKIWESTFPTKVMQTFKQNYVRYSCTGEECEELQLYKGSIWLFEEQVNFLKIYLLKDANSEDLQKKRIKYECYFNKIKEKYTEQDHKYPYLANSQIIFNSAFQVKAIDKITLKDILISEYAQEDYGMLKRFVRQNFGNMVNIEIYPFSRNIKICLDEEKYIRYIESQLLQLFGQIVFKQRPVIKVVPRNDRWYSQAKVLVVFYVPNKHERYKDNNNKYFNMLKDAQDQDEKNFQLSHKSDLEWKEQICCLLRGISVDPENCTINIWGNYDITEKNADLIQLCAEINSYESGIYQKLRKFHGKQKYLGCDSLFIRRKHQQILAFPSQRIFNCLKEEYLSIVISQKRSCRELTLVQKAVKMRNKNYAKIIAKSTDRQAVIRIAEKVHNLFEPRPIELQDDQIRFLTEIDRYSITQKVQHEYKYSIAFQMNRFTKSLVVYCPYVEYQSIVRKIKEYVKKSQYVSNWISYKGKNLNSVRQILDRFKETTNKKKDKLEYEILFNRKFVSVTTLPAIYLELKKQIEGLSSPISGDCQLCMGKLTSPYILINCQHSFCKICLLGYIKNQVNSQENTIKCANIDCKALVSMFDIELILGEHLFEKAADERVRKYVKQHSDRYKMCPKCGLILDFTPNDQAIRCETCGYYKCLHCGKNHKTIHDSCQSSLDNTSP